MATAFGAPLKDKPICFAGAELGAKRHICAFFNSRGEECGVLLPFINPMIIVGRILQENRFYVPPDEFVTELRQRREARKDSS